MSLIPTHEHSELSKLLLLSKPQQCGNWPEGKWHWMMEYCRRNLLHPGESANWKQAEKAYEERKECVE